MYTLVMNESALHFQLIQHISEQMCLAKLNEIEPYHLCWHRGFLEVHSAAHTYHPHQVFHQFTGQQVHKGCTEFELIKITSQIINFIEENPECLKQFKL